MIQVKISAKLFVYINEQILKFILKGKETRNPKQFKKKIEDLFFQILKHTTTICGIGEGTDI